MALALVALDNHCLKPLINHKVDDGVQDENKVWNDPLEKREEASFLLVDAMDHLEDVEVFLPFVFLL